MNNTCLGISVWIRKEHGENNPKRYAMLGGRNSLIMKRSISLRTSVRTLWGNIVWSWHVTWSGMAWYGHNMTRRGGSGHGAKACLLPDNEGPVYS